MIRIGSESEIVLQPTSCFLSMAINGVWIVKMEHPYDREGRWQYIEEDAVMSIGINALDGVDEVQQYRIHLCQRTLTTVYVEAYPIALDSFNNRVFTSISIRNASASQLANAITSNAYPVTTNISDTTRSDCSYENTNLIAVINGDEDSFVGKFGGEVRYNNNQIAINNRLDSGSTAYIYAGRDVTSLTHAINTTDVVTRIYPLSANGIRLNGSGYVDSPLVNQYGVPHSEFIKTHYMLCTEDDKNADIEAFQHTMGYKSQLETYLGSKLQTILEMQETWGDYKRNIEYIQDTMKRTKAKDKWRGLIEKLQDSFSAHVNNVAFKQMVRDWVKNAVDFVDEMEGDRENYKVIKLDLPEPTGTKYIYAEGNASSHGEPVKSEWIRLDNKWRWFNADGYLNTSKDDTHNWTWFTRSGDKYYGYKASNASDDIRVKNQWLKINGTWYWFKSDGTHDKPKSVGNDINNYFLALLSSYVDPSTGLVVDYTYEIAEWEQTLYNELWARMRAYCNHLFSQGIDKPKLEINLEAMDISQIEGYQQLQTLHLGNNVVFRNNGTNINERVVELEYDCIRKVNTKVVLGMPTETITAIISRNISQGQNLIAGYGVSLDGNVINIASGGGEAQAGLRWWEETSNHIERTMTSVPLGGWTCDDTYLIDRQVEWAVTTYDYVTIVDNGYKVNNQKAVGAWMHFYGGGYGRKEQAPVLLSPVRDAVQLNYSDDGVIYSYSNTISYGGLQWYVSCGTTDEEYPAELSPTYIYAPNYCDEWYFDENDYIVYSGDLPVVGTVYENFYHACLALLEIANVRTRNSFITGINVGENYPFYGGFVSSGTMTPENAPFRVDKNGNVVGKEFTAGTHRLTNKQDRLTAGQNVQIENNVISATDTTYSAGDNIQIDSNNEISATDTTYEPFEVGTDGLVPAPTSAEASANKYLKSDGTWAEVQGGGGGSNVSITPTLSSGTKIADYSIDGVGGSLFAPTGGGGSSDLDAIELTKAEYDALTPAEKADVDKVYFVKDYDFEGDSIIVYTTEYVEESEYEDYYVDHTFAQIRSAVNDGKIVYVIDTLNDAIPRIYKLIGITNSSTNLSFQETHGNEILNVSNERLLFRVRRASIQRDSENIIRFTTLQYYVDGQLGE